MSSASTRPREEQAQLPPASVWAENLQKHLTNPHKCWLGVNASGGPTLQVRVGDEVRLAGIARSNILDVPAGSEFAAGLMKARLREELRSTQKITRADVESDLVLLQQLLTPEDARRAIALVDP